MGNPVAFVPLPSGVILTRFYTRINALTNARGQATDLITPDQGSVTVAGITDAPPSSGAQVEAVLFDDRVSAGGLPETPDVVAMSDLEPGIDLHETDSLGNELYSFSVTLPTAGLAPGVYALQTFNYTPAFVQTSGVTTPITVFQYDTGTVTVQEFEPFTYVVHEDTEIVSAGAAQTSTAVYLPNANTSVQLSTDGRDVVWTSGTDQYEENVQTGVTVDLTTTDQPAPALQATLRPTNNGTVASPDPFGPAGNGAYAAISYPSFAEGGVTFGATPDFDFNANDGAQNPLPTATDASGHTAVLQPFGTTPTMVGYAAAASDNGNAVLVIDPYDVTYIPYGSNSATSASPQYYVVYRDPAPTLTAAKVSGSSSFEVMPGANGSDTLSGTSNAIGQAVEIDLGVAGDEAATANVRADGTWQAVFTLSGYTGPATLIVSVSSAAGTPTSLTGGYQVIAPPAAPVVTFYLPTTPSNDDDGFIEGNAAAGSTVTLYDTSGAALETTTTRSSGVFLFNSVILTEGTHRLTETATLNGLTSVASAPTAITIDLTPPAAMVTSLVVAGDDDITVAEQTAPDITVTGTISAPLAAGESVEVVGPDNTKAVATTGADGLSFTASLPTPGGPGTVSAYAQDTAGNVTATLKQAFSFDTVRKVVPIGQAVIGAGSGFESTGASLSDNGTIAAYTVSPAASSEAERAAVTVAAPAAPEVYVTNSVTGTTVEASAGLPSADDASLSGDGTRLVVEAVSGVAQVELIDLAAGTTTLLSHAAGAPATPSVDGAEGGSIAQDGAHAVFDSVSPDLGGGTAGIDRVYEVAVAAGTTRLVSGAAGAPGDGGSVADGVSADGSVVVFGSQAADLGPAGGGTSLEVYAATFDAAGNETIALASANAQGTAANDGSEDATVSANGRFVLFDSAATNLVAGAASGALEVYRKDLQTGALTLVSSTASGVAASDDSAAGGISDDGSLAVFATDAANLTGNPDGNSQVFVKNLLTEAVTLVSGAGLSGADGDSDQPAISGDGSTVAFDSNASDLVPGIAGEQSYVAAVAAQPPCYCTGTRIRTPGGEVAVESLAIGDTVMSASGEHRPVKWIGHRSYAGRFLAANPGVQPVRFCAGSLGDGLPRRDLLVSPGHSMVLGGLLIPARHLTNGSTVIQERGLQQVDYVHVELDSHDVLLAEGAPSESFMDDDSRGLFHNGSEFTAMYPDARPEGGFCAPRVEHGPELEAIRQRIMRVARGMARVTRAEVGAVAAA